MANRSLDVYRQAAAAGSPEIRPEKHGKRLIGGSNLTAIRTVEDSRSLNGLDGPMVIVSASGMATGGRVVHHLIHRIGDERNAVVLFGYQAPGTRGDRLARGDRSIKMLGGYHQVHAQIGQVGLSTHADQGELIGWLTSSSPLPRTVYVQHGEPEASRALADALHEGLGLSTVVPERGELVRLDAMSWS
jgi:metallo-beta-lactamase family protein